MRYPQKSTESTMYADARTCALAALSESADVMRTKALVARSAVKRAMIK